MTRWLGGISRLYADRRYPRGRILGASAAAVSGAADTAENILATINVPAGAMGLNGILRVTSFWSATNDASAKTVRVRLGGIGGTAFGSQDIASTAQYRQSCQIANRGSASSQHGHAGGGGGWSISPAAVTATIDTSAATTLVITAQKADGTDTMTLESYLVELIIPG